MNSYGRPIKRLPRKGLACQCKQDLFWFFWGCSVYIRGQLLGGGNVREAHISDTQQLSEVCKHYSRKKPKQIEWKIVKLKSLSWLKANWSTIWDFVHFQSIYFLHNYNIRKFVLALIQKWCKDLRFLQSISAIELSGFVFFLHYFKMCFVVTEWEIFKKIQLVFLNKLKFK